MPWEPSGRTRSCSCFAWLLGSVTAFFPLPFMCLVLRYRVIAMEEGMLEETFGDEYLEYKRKVRRWL